MAIILAAGAPTSSMFYLGLKLRCVCAIWLSSRCTLELRGVLNSYITRSSQSIDSSDIISLDFTVTRFLMKLFKSSNIDLINESRHYFNVQLTSELLVKRKDKFIQFIAKFMATESLLDYIAIQ